ncbi:MAG: hypothetical protein ABI744_06595 [Chloroflexota bacterium]
MNRLAALSLGLLVVGCAGYSVPPQATPSPIGTGQPTSAPASSATPQPVATGPQAEIELLITGGPHDGSFRAVTQGGCHYAPAQNKFTVTYADNGAADGFVALDLVLNDAALAKTDESDSLTAEISVGGADGGISYALDPKNGEGDGTVFLDTSPTDATLDLEVDAPDGATIDLTVICDLAGS